MESNAPMYSNTTPSQSTTLVLDQSTLFSTGGANVLVVTMDQRQPLLELARYVYIILIGLKFSISNYSNFPIDCIV